MTPWITKPVPFNIGQGVAAGDTGFDKTGIKVYYQFDNTSGGLTNQATTANGFPDGTGSTNDGTNGSGVTLDVAGIIDRAYDYDAGANGYTNIGNDVFTGTGDYSLNVWLYHDLESGNDSGLVGGTNQELAQYQASTDKYIAGNNPTLATTSAIGVNNWDMLSYTRSGTDAIVYFNGTQENTGSNSVNIVSGSWHIGGVSGGSENWHGRIDELCIAHNRVFSSDEIETLFNSGAALNLLA